MTAAERIIGRLPLTLGSARALLGMVRREIKSGEVRARKPHQIKRVKELKAAGKFDVHTWRLDRLRELEDSIAHLLADAGVTGAAQGEEWGEQGLPKRRGG